MISLHAWRRQLGSHCLEGFFRSLTFVAKQTPWAKLSRHGVEVMHDIQYLPSSLAAHRLDVYRPVSRPPQAPVVVYFHGGGFRMLSKDTHWLMALAFARRGYVVFNVNYRLAPLYPFPHAVADAADAFMWIIEHARDFGGDASRLVLAGESAGANLAVALTVSATFKREEAYAQRVFDTNVVPQAVVAACGIYQVSDSARFRRANPRLSWLYSDRLRQIEEAYLPSASSPSAQERELADPVLFLEETQARAVRPLPPFFLPVGSADPLLEDTHRLHAALKRVGATSICADYPGGMHAFLAFVWQQRAQQCWRDIDAFLQQHVPSEGVPTT